METPANHPEKRSPIRVRIGYFGGTGIYPAALIREKAALLFSEILNLNPV
jgi:hypothetical protein